MRRRCHRNASSSPTYRSSQLTRSMGEEVQGGPRLRVSSTVRCREAQGNGAGRRTLSPRLRKLYGEQLARCPVRRVSGAEAAAAAAGVVPHQRVFAPVSPLSGGGRLPRSRDVSGRRRGRRLRTTTAAPGPGTMSSARRLTASNLHGRFG